MKDVFFVNSSKDWGGGEKWHLTAAKSLSQEFNVSIVAAPGGQLAARAKESQMTTHMVDVSNLSFMNPFKVFRVYRILKISRNPCVILNLPSDVKVAGIAAKLAGVKKIIYRRGMPKPIKDSWVNRFLFGRVVTDVIVNSEEIGRSLTMRNKSMVDKSKVHLIYNGIDIGYYDSFDGESVVERSENSLILGTTGRMVDQKNQLMLVEMVANLKSLGFDVKLYIAGTGPLKAELERRIAGYGLQDDIVLLGFLADTRQLLTALDVFVFPSRYEGSANALAEAMAMRLPIVAYDTSSMPEMVDHEKTGLLARYDDESDFLEKVIRLLQDRSLRSEMGAMGKRKAEVQFSHARSMERVREILVN